MYLSEVCLTKHTSASSWWADKQKRNGKCKMKQNEEKWRKMKQYVIKKQQQITINIVWNKWGKSTVYIYTYFIYILFYIL